MRMTEADVLRFEQDIFGAEAGAKAETAETALSILSDLAKTGGSVATQIKQKQKEKAGLTTTQPTPQKTAENPFMHKAGGVPVYGWILIGLGGLGAVALIAKAAKKRR